MSLKKGAAYFCILTLAIFQLAVVTSFANCCCTVKQEVQSSLHDAEKAKDATAEQSCCAVEPVQDESVPHITATDECFSIQKEKSLCACDHKHTPAPLDASQVILPNNSKQEHTVSIRLIPINIPVAINSDLQPIYTPINTSHYATVLMQTVVLLV